MNPHTPASAAASPVDAVERAIADVTTARRRVSRRKSRQITTVDEVDYLKSVAYAWFQSHRRAIDLAVVGMAVADVDAPFQRILDATAKHAARSTYVSLLTDSKTALVVLRGRLVAPAASSSPPQETAPDFSPLVGDPAMRGILARRWGECQRCLRAEAHLAATVMMGGLVEALFVARANTLADKSPLFRAKASPIGGKTKKPLQLTEWTLRAYIDVGYELRWITKSGREVAAILRDYRNYVHPEKERSDGVLLSAADSAMFWEVTKVLVTQILRV